MLFRVPGASSSLGLPGTVTRPGLLACLYWRWLPRVATRRQPPAWSNLRTSLTFMGERYHNGKVQGDRRATPLDHHGCRMPHPSGIQTSIHRGLPRRAALEAPMQPVVLARGLAHCRFERGVHALGVGGIVAAGEIGPQRRDFETVAAGRQSCLKL